MSDYILKYISNIKSQKRIYTLGGIIFIIIVCLIIILPTKSQSSNLSGYNLKIGVVAVTEETLEELVLNTDSLPLLVKLGEVFIVDNGTRINVLKGGFAIAKVRILEGPYAGMTGWVPNEFVEHLGEVDDEGGCFIATAVYNTALNPEIDILRDFRDVFLLKNNSGKKFVKFYYENSPPVANFISERFILKGIIREMGVKPIVKVIKLTENIWNQ